MNLFWQFICMIAFGAACWAAGDILLKNFLRNKVALSTLTRHTLAFATGNVAISYLLTALGFIRAFVPPVLWAVFFMGIGITLWRITGEFGRSHNARSVNQTIRGETKKWIVREMKEEKSAYIFGVVIMGLFFLPAILQAAAPPYVRDSLVYHLLGPKEYLRAGRLIHIDGNIFSAFPKGHEVLMTLLLAIAGDRAAQGFSILQQIASISGLYGLIRLTTRPWPAMLCTVGYATVPPAIYFMGCGYVEPAFLMTFGSVLLALAFFLKLQEGEIVTHRVRIGMTALIGFLAGWMPALKYTGLIYFGLTGLILLWSQRKASMKKALYVNGLFILLGAPGLCWMVWNWVALGNPVYPMAWFLFDGRGWDEGRALAMSIYLDIFGMGRNLLDYLLLPWRMAFMGRFDSIHFDGAIGPFLLLFLALAVASGCLLICRRINGRMMKQIGFILVVSALFFIYGTQQTRFWLPSQMLTCALAAPALERLVTWMRSRRLIMMVLFLTVIGSLVWNIWFLGKQVLAVNYYKPVLGMEQERAFLVRKVPGYPALEFINQNLPEHSRTLCVWTGAYGYYINRRYYSDTFIEDITLKRFIKISKNGNDLSQKLIQAGFTHLFLQLPMLGKNMEPDQHAVFNDFLKNGSFELYHYQGFSIFAIHGG